MHTSFPIFLFLLGSLLSGFAFAEPVILLDEGGVPTDNYRQVLRSPTKVPDFGGQWVSEHSPLIQKDPKDLSVWLPLVTHKLTPKRLTSDSDKKVHYGNLDAPICIIGSDRLSREWVRLHLDNLLRLRARCWLVQANNFEDFTDMSSLLQGKIMLIPADGDTVANFFGIKHYPVYIDEGFIGQ